VHFNEDYDQAAGLETCAVVLPGLAEEEKAEGREHMPAAGNDVPVAALDAAFDVDREVLKAVDFNRITDAA
jgi:hypothetical protein